MLGDHVEVGGRRFGVEYVKERRKTLAAYFYSDKVTIKLPSHMGIWGRAKVLESLERRVIKRLEKMSDKGFEELDRSNALPTFTNGQRIVVMGREFGISIREDPAATYSRARRSGSEIMVTIPAHFDPATKEERVSNLVRKVLSKCMLQDVRSRLDAINEEYYGFSYNEVRIRKQMRLWGSASYPQNNINLSYRLLFAPQEILVDSPSNTFNYFLSGLPS